MIVLSIQTYLVALQQRASRNNELVFVGVPIFGLSDDDGYGSYLACKSVGLCVCLSVCYHVFCY